MAAIEGFEKIVAKLGRWSPNYLAYIEAIEIVNDRSTSSTVVRVTGLFQPRDASVLSWPDEAAPFVRLRLDFEGVRDIRLRASGGGRCQIMGFDIVDVADKGWEGVNFEVLDYEDDRLFFRCRNVSVEAM